jgi:FkbH-like protein
MYELRNRFAKHHVTDEDRVRRQSLEAAEAFRVCNRQTSSYEIFMRGAQAEMTADFACEARTPRSLELINKTNQFNLNGVRYTQSEWHDSLISPNSFALNASYRDRYGPLGLIAVLKGHVENKTIFLDTWVMSCRAFARRIEYQCLRVLFERFGAEYTHFAFTPTQRNGPLQEFFATLLGERPAQPFRLSHGVFHAKCPELYHKVEVKL